MQGSYDLLEEAAALQPDKTAIVCGEEAITYGDFCERARAMAALLKERGVSAGTRVGVSCPPTIEAAATFYALQRLGAVAVMLSTKESSRVIQNSLATASCDILVYADRNPVIAEVIEQGVVSGFNLHESAGASCSNGANAEKFQWSPDDDALIVFTSGTTGAPKAITHTESSLMAMWAIGRLGLGPSSRDEVYASYAPLNHLAGISRMISTLSAGGTLILMSRFSVEELVDNMEQRGLTGFLLIPPTFIYRLAHEIERRNVDASCVKRIDTGATVVPPDAIGCMFKVFPEAQILTGYGQSECYPVTFLALTSQECRQSPSLQESIGTLGPFVEARVVDDQGQEVPNGSAGELWVKSPMTMRRTEANADVFTGPWLATGDMVYRDEQGYYYFVGRLRDVVKSGGEYVSPAEVEKVVIGHPAVVDCKVVGAPSSDFGEILVAGVVLDPRCKVGEQELKEFCRETLARFKIPKRFFFFDGFERTETGKIKAEAARRDILARISES